MSETAQILVVDDESANRRLLSDLVKREGFEAVTASGGAEALEYLLHHTPDVVLLDMMMPEVDGMAVLAELRNRRLIPELPVVIVTAHDDRQTRIDALKSGATDFLTKPIDRVEVACRIHTLVELKRLRQAAVSHATDALLADVREAVGSLPLVLYRSPYQNGAENSAAGWVVGDLPQLAGITSSEFSKGDPWVSLIHPEDREAYLHKIQESLSARGNHFAEQFRVLSSEDNVRWLLNVATFDKDKRMQTGAILDITAQKELELSLLQAQKMEAFGQLAGGVAHDFNNILAVILALGQAMRDVLPASAGVQEDISEMIKAANHGVGLTKQLLTFSRNQTCEPSPTDLHRNISQLTKLLTRTLGDHIELVVKASDHPAIVRIDPVQFEQVILNLAVNARQAMPQGGRLQIALGYPPSHVDGEFDKTRIRITVSDTGTGMDLATQRRIFEPFFTTKPKGQGTGLGLATCFRIVENAGGTLRVQSALGSGTSFEIELPNILTSPTSLDAQEDFASQFGQGLSVLLAEDEPALRKITAFVLEDAGYEVHVATDGAEAIRALRAFGMTLDVVICDVVMPECSGYDVASMAESLAPQATIILTSGYYEGLDVPPHLAHLPVLWKPANTSEIISTVARAIVDKQSRAGQTLPSSTSNLEDYVMLVGCDPSTAKALQRVLGVTGIRAETMNSLAEARRAMEQGIRPRAVLCDIVTWDEPLKAFVAWARDALRTSDAKLVLLAGHTVDEELKSLFKQGSYHFLPKPFDPAILRRLLSEKQESASSSPSTIPPTFMPAARNSIVPSARRSTMLDSTVGRILVVDDYDLVATAYNRVLNNAGFEVEIAGSLKAAYQALQRGNFDALIVDIALPDGSGLEIVKELRGRHFELPVIVISGAPTVSADFQQVRGRLHKLLGKPVANDELLRAVDSAVETGRIARLRTTLLAAYHGGDQLTLDLPSLENCFERALNSVDVVYQPIVRASDGSIHGYEAFLTCPDPALDSGPRLLAAASLLGRIDEVGRVLRSSVAVTLHAHAENASTIFISVHPSELLQNLPIDDTDPLLPFAQRVVFEIAERASIPGGPKLEEMLKSLRERGYRLAVQGVGEDYAGFSNFLVLRPQIAKIDRTLVHDVHRSTMKQKIVQSIVDMAHRSNTSVVAEGVETLEEYTALVALGCDLLQGIYFAQPGPPFPVIPSPVTA